MYSERTNQWNKQTEEGIVKYKNREGKKQKKDADETNVTAFGSWIVIVNTENGHFWQ